MIPSASSLPQDIRAGRYSRSWVRPDLLAGFTVAAMLVPQAMAYAELGGLPASAGFRAALVALPLYAVIGTSKHLGIGPEPGTAVMASLAVAPLAGGDPQRYLELMALLAGMVGAMALLGGALRIGFVADLLSKPVLVGYISGVGLTLLSSQYATFFGVDINADGFAGRTVQMFGRLDQIQLPVVAIGIGVLVCILVLRRVSPAAPGALIALGLAMMAVATFELDISTVGRIDAAFPTPSVPSVSPSDVRQLLPAAAGLTLIAFTDNVLTARAIAAKKGYSIDPSRELAALGAMNVGGAFGGGFPMSSSASRTIVPATIGSRSQMSSIFCFLAVLGFLGAGRDLLAEIPRAALAAVIVAAAFAVIDIRGFRELSQISWPETTLALATCLAVISTDLLVGVLIAVGLATLMAMARIARPEHAVLGAAPGLDGWIPLSDPRAQDLPGLLVYRFDAPLFFANAEHYCRTLFELAEDRPGDERHMILDMEGVGSVDATAADHLLDLQERLAKNGISIAFARPNGDVREVLHRSGLIAKLPPRSIHATINSAVSAFRDRPAEMVD